jgi:hypothetical protein
MEQYFSQDNKMQKKLRKIPAGFKEHISTINHDFYEKKEMETRLTISFICGDLKFPNIAVQKIFSNFFLPLKISEVT